MLFLSFYLTAWSIRKTGHLIHSPELMIFDEPTSNLDVSGKDKVYEIIERESKNNLIIIASNEESDLALCKERIFVKEYK